MVRVLSYNCCALPLLTRDIPARLAVVAEKILELDADVVLLQEVFLASHLRILLRRLGHAHVFWTRRFPGQVAGGLVLLSRRPLLSAAFRSFREQGEAWRFSALLRINPKGFMHVVLDRPRLHLIHTHLVANYNCSADPLAGSARNAYARFQGLQVSELRRFLALLDDRPALLCGDLNLQPASELLRALKTDGFLDPMEGAGPSVVDGKYDWIPFQPARDKRLDYALVRGPLSVRAARYALTEPVIMRGSRPRTPSDHFGVLVDLSEERGVGRSVAP